jgi:hypothetical protein
MGFVTTRWLKGDPERNRDHHPVEGEVSDGPWHDYWARLNNVVFRIKVKRSDGDYQVMYFNQGEVDKIALDMLAKRTDAELLQFLTRLLSERAKTTVSGSAEAKAANIQP